MSREGKSFVPRDFVWSVNGLPVEELKAALAGLNGTEKYALRIHLAAKRETVELLYTWVRNGWL
jgi:hypothetical protein